MLHNSAASQQIVPEVGFSMAANIFSNDVLPQPDGPHSATCAPLCNDQSASCSNVINADGCDGDGDKDGDDDGVIKVRSRGYARFTPCIFNAVVITQFSEEIATISAVFDIQHQRSAPG